MQMTKKQGIVFGLIMSYAMAIGMEVYNVAIKMGFTLHNGGLSNMTNQVFPAALLEASYMGAIVLSSPVSGATASAPPLPIDMQTRKKTTPIFTV